MHPFSASEVLRAWELGQPQHPVERALTLLALSTGTPREQLAALPIGQRDALLLRLREATLGSRLESIAQCPSCSERVEMSFQASDILVDNSLIPSLLPSGISRETEKFTIEAQGYHIVFRLPDSHDLVAIKGAPSLEEARQALVHRCVVEVVRNETPLDPSTLPTDVEKRLSERILQADPLADITIDMTCPNCSYHWQVAFDISAYFWTEINSLAQRLIHDVHTLARAYGWREADILAMSAVRRQAYLEMATG